MGLRKDRNALTLFAPFKLGQIALKNRIVMASMTRGRTTNPGHVPNDVQVEYYRQRASAGLILTEGTWVSRDAIGFINVPGLFTPAQSALPSVRVDFVPPSQRSKPMTISSARSIAWRCHISTSFALQAT